MVEKGKQSLSNLIDVSRWTTQRVPVKVNTTHKTSLHRSLQAGSKVFGFSLTIPFPNTAAEFMRSLFRALCSHDAALNQAIFI